MDEEIRDEEWYNDPLRPWRQKMRPKTAEDIAESIRRSTSVRFRLTDLFKLMEQESKAEPTNKDDQPNEDK